jgi:acetyl esterase/lipase
LAEVSTVLTDVIGRFAVRVAAQEGARILAPALIGALALPVSVVMAVRGAIDNVWAATLSMARSAASPLAESLPEFGRRPITLAGCSAGAGMIFWALEELARNNRVGLVHDVYLIGASIRCDIKRWERVRTVASGRFVNGHWTGDWFLEVAQRTT